MNKFSHGASAGCWSGRAARSGAFLICLLSMWFMTACQSPDHIPITGELVNAGGTYCAAESIDHKPAACSIELKG